jgi:hypothetical protein
MKRIVSLCLVVLAVGVVQRATGARASGADLALFDAPRGAWLASVRPDTPLVVLEERDGWRRVRVEGWIAIPADRPGGEAAGQGSPAGTVRPVARGAVVQGVLLPTTNERAASPGSGLIVLLVSDLEALDAQHAGAGATCTSHIAEIDARLERMRSDKESALQSSDNFREATARDDRLKAEISSLEAVRGKRVAECQRSAGEIFQQHAVRRAISDDAGRFEFRDVPPGRYRVVATEVGSARAWSLECVVGDEASIILDPRRDASDIDPYWGIR